MVKLVFYNVKNFFFIVGLEFFGKFGIWKLMLLNVINYRSVFFYKYFYKKVFRILKNNI